MSTTYPAPSADLIEAARVEMTQRQSGRPTKAAFTYARASTVEIQGHRVRMPTATAITILRQCQHQPYIPVAVAPQDYLRAKAIDERWSIFRDHCDRMGLVNAQEKSISHCSACGTSTEGMMEYAPDAGGYPTPVMFTCGTCGHKG